jgi:hypothetical protein
VVSRRITTPSRLLELAARVDAGFDVGVFVDMLDSLARFTDDEIPALDGDPASVRRFASQWASSPRRSRPNPDA